LFLDQGFITLDVSIPPSFAQVTPDYFIIVLTDIYHYKSDGVVDVELAYTIKDEEGGVISIKTLTIAVETHLSDIQKIEMPADIPAGRYILVVEASMPGQKSLKASKDFDIIEAKSAEGIDHKRYAVYMMSLISLLAIITIYLIYKLIGMEERRRKNAK